MTKSPLFREIGGYNAQSDVDDLREEPFQTSSNTRYAPYCQYLDGPCNKSTTKDEELGMYRTLSVCSATENDGTPVITCPSRFHADSVFEDLREFFFGNTALDVRFENEITMGDVGKMDFVGVLLDQRDVKDMVGIEIQTSYFQGDEIRTLHDDYMDKNNEGKSPAVPTGTREIDYRSCIDKRLLPQLRQKVELMNEFNHHFGVVVQDVALENSPVLSRVEPVTENEGDIFWFSYEYIEDTPSYRLELDKVVPTRLEDINEAIPDGQIEEGYRSGIEQIQNRLVSTDGGTTRRMGHQGQLSDWS